MTTAHRPTWKAAVARASETNSGIAYTTQSVLDISAHTKLKIRSTEPSLEARTKSDIVRASLLKLKEAEDKLRSNTVQKRVIVKEIEEEGRNKVLKQTADVDEKLLLKYDDADEEAVKQSAAGNGGVWSDVENDSKSSGLDDSDSSDEDSSDDEDEEALLKIELARIRAEREEANQKVQQQVDDDQQAKMEEEALVGNPLLLNNNSSASDSTNPALVSGKLKRRWNDDVVFRNQAKGEPQQNLKRFINDTVRNDFHKRFLNKFMK